MKNRALKAFGDNVRAGRIALGFSQEQLASKCGLHRTYVGSVERGERNVGLENIVRIACALQVRPEILVANIDCESHSDFSEGQP